MLVFISSLLAAIRVFFQDRGDVALEVLALRQQLAVLKRKRPRPRLIVLDRLFWISLLRFWSRWAAALVIVKPETVIGWHRAGFRLYWRWRSRPHSGRPKMTGEIRRLIRQMAEENSGWVHRRSTANFKSSDSQYRNGPLPGIFGVCAAVATRANTGWRSSKTIAR
jgi:putative transposase